MISQYLSIPDLAYISDEKQYKKYELGSKIPYFSDNFGDLYSYEIAILGVRESRNSTTNNLYSEMAPDEIRKYLYRLTTVDNLSKIIDLGNIINCETVTETYENLELVLNYLYKSNIKVIVLGGTQDITNSQFLAYKNIQKEVDVTIVDEKIDINMSSSSTENILCDNYLENMFRSSDPKLDSYNHLGLQSYYAIANMVNKLKSNFYNIYRLGEIRYEMANYNHTIRNSDMVSIDISVVKQSDAPARSRQTPNGLNSDELCQITRMAGMSNKVSSIGIYEVNPQLDFKNLTTQLAAQAVWYFIEGFSIRMDEIPSDNNNFKEYMVEVPEYQEKPLHFYFSKITKNWWVKFADTEEAESYPCSRYDYELCIRGEITSWLMNLMSKEV